MADRSVVVRLRAEVAGFRAAMAEAAASARSTQRATEEAGAGAETSMGRMVQSADRHKEAWEKAGTAMLGFGAAAVGGVALAVKAYADFDAKMSQVQSLSHASAGDMETLTQAALTAGGKIGFSAVEVADAEIELVKAGASVKDMMGGALVGALTLAAAGQIEVGKATEIATIAMTQFKLSGKDIPHVSDLLAAGADKALGGVQELGDGLKQGGLVASQFGLTIDDTVGTLSAFANAGLLGSDAGTSMKTMFLSLASPSKQAQQALDQYNITAYDSEGKFKGVADLAGQLHDKLGGLSDAQRNAALSTIFGTDAMRSASVLMNEGREGIAKWISDVNDQGFAAAQAAGKMDNMNGDLKKLGASFQTGLIEMGQSADGFLRPLIQNVTKAIEGFNGLPQPVKGFGLAAAASVGGVALLAGGFLMLAPKVLDTVNGFRTLAQDMPRLASGLGSLGKAAIAATVAFIALQATAAINNAFMPAAAGVDQTTQALVGLKKNSGAVDDLFKAFSGKDRAADDINGVGDALHRINNMQWNDNLNKFGNDVFGMQDQLKPARDQIDKLDQSLSSLTSSGSQAAAADGFKHIAEQAQKQGVSVETTAKSFPQYLDSLRQLASEQKIQLKDNELLDWAMGKIPPAIAAAGDATGVYTDKVGNSVPITKDQSKALADVGLSANGAVTALDKLVTSLINTGLLQLSANDAARAYQAAIDAVTDSIAKNGKTLDIHTPKGRENSAAFDGIAKSGLAAAEAMAKNGQSQQEVQGQLGQTYNDLIAAAGKFDITGDAADTMARKALGIPKGVDINAWLHDHASAEIDKIVGKADAANGKVIDIYAYTHDTTLKKTLEDPGGMGSSIGGRADGSLRGGAATGGLVIGAGFGMRAFKDGGHVGGFATAGYVQGPGSGTSDSILARLSNGEFVVRASMVNKYGLGFMDSLNKGSYSPGKAMSYSAPVQQQAYQRSAGAASFTGALYLDSGQFLGMVRGEASQVTATAMNDLERSVRGMR